MTALKDLGRVAINREAAGRVNEFVSAVRYLMTEKGGSAAKLAERNRASDRTVEFLKTATTPGAMTVGNWAEPLAPFQNLATAFLSSLSAISVFDGLWPNMVQAPLRTHVVVVSTTLTASAIAEASIKPASRLSLAANDLDVVKCAAFLAVSQELLRSSVPSALVVLQRELQTAIARCTNSVFLPILTSGATSFVSSGTSASAVRQDLRTLLATVSSGAGSKLVFIVTRTIAEALSMIGDSSGGPAFPNATVNGGQIGGVPVIVADEAVSGEIILCDSSQVAAGQEGLKLDTTNEAMIQLDTVGDSPVTASTVMSSLWQLNLVAIKAERFIGAKVLRSDAVAKVTGVGYVGGSPS